VIARARSVQLRWWLAGSVALAACGPTSNAPPPKPPHAPTTVNDPVANLVAFATLLGDLRFFHPSDEGANADWDALAVAAIPRVEEARNPDELAKALTAIFRPVAPTVRIYTSGRAPPLPPALVAPARSEDATFAGWLHYGVHLDDPQPIYSRVLVTNRSTPHPAPSDLHQPIAAEVARRKTLRVRASARAELPNSDATASVVVVVWQRSGFRVIASAPVTSADWMDVDLAGEGPDAERMQVHVGLRVTGDGKAWIDDVTASLAGTPLRVENGDFESTNAGELPAGWFNEDQSGTTSALRPHKGIRCGAIHSTPLPLERLPTPAQTLHVPLGSGVDAELPLTLYLDADGHTLPRSARRGPPASLRPDRLFGYSASQRSVRLADVALSWGVLQHFYPYFDVVAVDWAAELRIALFRAIGDTGMATFHGTLKRLVAALHDGHGGVSIEESNARKEKVGERAGMPLAMRVIEGQLVVTAVAAGAGDIKPGDIVESIDGVPASRALAASGEMISAATPQWLALREALVIDFGPKGESVPLTLRRGRTGATYAARLRRTEDSDVARTRVEPDKLAELEPGILYVDLDRITDDDFDRALTKLVSARGVIFDLRGYPKRVSVMPLRHLTGETMMCPEFFITKTKRPNRDGVELKEERCTLAPLAPRLSGKIVFLTDAQAISYAETYLGIVEAYKLATIVGETTAGTNGNVNSFMLPGGYRVTFTGTRVLKNDGSRHHGVGIAPTVPCARTIEGVAAGRDEILECGVATMKSPR
jgi:C-terminal processing protease CtpA/Prc